jgi:rhamnosyltransferase subunit B
VHYICSTFGSAGDVFPILGLAVELKRRGHQVTFVTNAHFQNAIERNGISFISLGTEDDFKSAIRNPDIWHPRNGFRHVYQSLEPLQRQQYDIFAELMTDDAVGITNVFCLGALLAQEKLGIPVITVHLQPTAIWSDRDPPMLPALFGPNWLKSIIYRLGERLVIDPVVCPSLNKWRAELGLKPVRKVTRWWHSRYGVLCLFSDWYAAPQTDWPQPLMQTDFPLWNDQSDLSLPQGVESFLNRGEPPIAFTPGSANIHAERFFQSAVEACRILNCRGILLTQFPEQLPVKLPDSVKHVSYAPLDLLLPRTAAFVHHGGIGSMSQAMLAGIPHVIMPLAHDQFDNAIRVKRLGLGTSIAAAKFSGPSAAAALKQILGNQAVSDACRKIADLLAKKDGLSRAADAIESRVAQGVAF